MPDKLLVFYEITVSESIEIPDNATDEEIQAALKEYRSDLELRHKNDGEVRIYHYEKE